MHPFEISLNVGSAFTDIIMKKLAPSIRPVDFIYHYTSIDSFLKIMSSNELWLSHASYMNDPLEVEFGISVILNIMKRKMPDSKMMKILEKQMVDIKYSSLDLKRDLAFVFSFSETDDHLPSWIQYGNSGNGICIGLINSKLLSTISPLLPTNKHMYFPVQYYAKHYEPSRSNIQGFENAVIDYYKLLDEKFQNINSEDEHHLKNYLYEMTKLLAAFIKHDFHEEEKEWRLVLFSGIGEKNIEVYSSMNSIKMSYRIEFREQKIMSLVDSLKVGPCHNEDERVRAALEIALWKYQGTHYNVQFSKGKIRNSKT
jgi:Protein of unknown function (DUF2971).